MAVQCNATALRHTVPTLRFGFFSCRKIYKPISDIGFMYYTTDQIKKNKKAIWFNQIAF